jgi:hypothetical protein
MNKKKSIPDQLLIRHHCKNHYENLDESYQSTAGDGELEEALQYDSRTRKVTVASASIFSTGNRNHTLR